MGAYTSQSFGTWPASFGSATLGPWQYSLYVTFGRSPVQTTQYDGDGNVVRQIDANGDVTTSSYDPWQRQVATTNPVSGTSIMTYSATEQVASRDPQGNVTTSVYDGAGRLLQTTDPSGGVTQYQYDPQGNTTTITSTATGGGSASQVETRRYDAQDEVISDTVTAPGDAQPRTTLTAYDLDGNAIQTEQPNGDTVFDTYDLANERATETIEPAPVPAPDAPSYTKSGYDAAGNLTTTTDGDGRTQTTSYDGDSRTTQEVDTGTTTAALTTTPQYDPDGNVVWQQVVTATAGSATTTSGYNAADWPITTTETSSDGTSPLTTAYGYDAAGQERMQTILDGQTPVTTTLDAEGRVMALGEGAGTTSPYTSTFGYYPTDLPMTATLPGGKGVGLNWTYDGSDRVTHAGLLGPDTGAVTTTLKSSYDYQYDAATGWTTALTETVNALYGGQPTPQLFTHDAQGRLRQWQWPTQQNLDEQWSYDGNGNVTTNHEYIDGQYRTTYYTYTASLPNELQPQHTEGLGIETYTYDQYGNTTSLSATDALTGTYGVSDTVGYDSHARPVTIRVKSQAYSTITQAVFSTVTFGYNAQGQRSSYAVSTPGYPGYRASYRYRDDSPNVAQAVVASGTVTGTVDYTDTYLYDQNGLPYELLRQYQGQPLQRYWYEEDGQGDVVALTDVNGNVVDRYAYDPWGEGLAGTVSEQVPQPLRYRGYWWDPELGWYWVSVRSLDPEGRWLQPDPSQQDGVRTYAYLNDDPVDGADPSGQQGPYPCEDVFGAIGGAQPACEGGGGPHDGPPLGGGGNGGCGAAPLSVRAAPTGCGSGDTTPPPNDNEGDRAASRAEPQVPWLRELYDRLPQSLKDQIQQFKDKWYKSNLPTEQDTLTYHWNKWARPRGINPKDYTERAKTFYSNFRSQGHRRGVTVKLNYPLEDGTTGIKITAIGRVGIFKDVDGGIKVVDYYPEGGSGSLGGSSTR